LLRERECMRGPPGVPRRLRPLAVAVADRDELDAVVRRDRGHVGPLRPPALDVGADDPDADHSAQWSSRRFSSSLSATMTAPTTLRMTTTEKLSVASTFVVALKIRVPIPWAPVSSSAVTTVSSPNEMAFGSAANVHIR